MTMAPRVQVMLVLVAMFCVKAQTRHQFSRKTQQSEPSAVFVFGDSLVDPGNNNYIDSLARANLLFNGIDFPGGPTGRFCNGRTVVDIISRGLLIDNGLGPSGCAGDIFGVSYPPPFLNPSTNGSKLLRGVNYASGAGGILDATGENFFGRMCMNKQISNFQDVTLGQIETQLGKKATTDLLGASLIIVVIGSNDFINNYLLEESDSQNQYGPRQFNSMLVDTFTRQLTTLYNSGFRNFYISGLGPIGCIPHQLALAGQTDCVSSVNRQIQDYNTAVTSMVQQLNDGLTGATFLFGKVYDSLTRAINNPGDYGFTVVNQGCCGGGLYRGETPCDPAARLCPNRAEYLFWDAYHPSEASNIYLANDIYGGALSAISPMNLRQLFAHH